MMTLAHTVMAALEAAIQPPGVSEATRFWMAGSSPAMTTGRNGE
jgi:hypothetical protein